MFFYYIILRSYKWNIKILKLWNLYRSVTFSKGHRILVFDLTGVDAKSIKWSSWLSLSWYGFSSFISSGFQSIISLNSSNKSSSALWWSNMFDSNVDSFMHNSTVNQFINNHTDWSGIYVKYSSSSSMIIFKRHTFVLGSVNNYINVITNLIGSKVIFHTDGSVLSETFSKKFSCTSS